MKRILSFFVLCCSLFAADENLSIKPSEAVIVVSPKQDGAVRAAASEFQRHLTMLTGKELPIVQAPAPGKYSFIFGTPQGVTLKTEEARWEVTPTAARIYGDSTRTGSPTDGAVWSDKSKSGDLYAVYDFLEKQLGFLFLAPGPDGTAFEPTDILNLKTGSASWDPGRLLTRHLRPVCPTWVYDRYAKDTDIPAAFKLSKEDYFAKNHENVIWLKQQRMGASVNYIFGHAFTKWWEKYGDTHPEYFALFKGKRAPERPNRPDTIKMCPSCKALHEQIVKDWLSRPNYRHYINVCENDWADYCECPECRKLDMPPPPGKDWRYDLSDRYLYFANAVQRLAREKDPLAQVCTYAYAAYVFPPRREHVEPGIVIGFVPSMLNTAKVDKMYQEWRKMGADMIYQRPNDQHVNIGLPMGFEKTLFEHFQVGVKNHIFGTDYDCIHGYWDVNGIADYILARAHIDPAKPFDYWMDEYCSAFGPAAENVKAYYTYWRTAVWETRILPNRDYILERGKYGFFRGGIFRDLDKYYKIEDFDKTDAMIANGLKKPLTPSQRKRLETLKLAAEHNRLTLVTMLAQGDEKALSSVKLFKFRLENKDKLNINWGSMFKIEKGQRDITGFTLAEKVGGYAIGKYLPTWFYFMPDKDRVGDKEHWETFSFQRYSTIWYPISVEYPWEKQPHYPTDALETLMKDYDGIGYYGQKFRVPPSWKGHEIALRFGAVDESAWVYVNGKFCGERVYQGGNEWQEPFNIRIDQAIDWTAEYQSVVIKVEDTAGAGGVWKLVMQVMR